MRSLIFTGLFIFCTNIFASVVMLGDSITKGANWQKLLNNKEIVNLGINGDTVYNMLIRIEDIPKETKKVFIMGGINDIVKGYSVESIFINYKQIINNLLKKGFTVYIQSTLLTGSRIDPSVNIKVKKLNKLLKEFASKKNIKFFDLNRYLSKENYLKRKYTFDEVHLNSTGYYIWSNVIEGYVK